MKVFPLALVFGSMLAATWPTAAPAHSWYPKECCNENDCAPVVSFRRLVPIGGGLPQLVVRSRHGTAVVPDDFPVRVSKDGRMHVCMRQNELGTWDVMCLFMPPPA
jgi:hypothetical protein